MRNKLNSKMLLPTIIATLHDNLHRTKEQFHSFLQRMAVTNIIEWQLQISIAMGNQIIKRQENMLSCTVITSNILSHLEFKMTYSPKFH